MWLQISLTAGVVIKDDQNLTTVKLYIIHTEIISATSKPMSTLVLY